MTLSDIFGAVASLFGRPMAQASSDTTVQATDHAASPASTPAPVVATTRAITVLSAAPVAPLPVTPAPARDARKTSSWLDLCLPVTKHFESCELVAYCDPASPRGRAIAADGLWNAYLRDRTIGDHQKYALLSPTPWTCGYGSTGSDVTRETKWTQSQADARLAQQLLDAGASVDHFVKVRLTACEKAALADFVFNEGQGHFASSTLLLKLNAGDTTGAAAQLLVWNMAGGHVYAGLEARRQAEKQLFTTGAWQP